MVDWGLVVGNDKAKALLAVEELDNSGPAGRNGCRHCSEIRKIKKKGNEVQFHRKNSVFNSKQTSGQKGKGTDVVKVSER